jgi:hypothetical protein
LSNGIGTGRAPSGRRLDDVVSVRRWRATSGWSSPQRVRESGARPAVRLELKADLVAARAVPT